MRSIKTIAALGCAFGIASASALAAQYPEEYGASPSIVPAAPDETGKVNNVPEWSAMRRAPDAVDDYFARYDANGDGAVSWEEAQQDPDLVRVFSRADRDRDGMLTLAEFHDAALLARDEVALRRP